MTEASLTGSLIKVLRRLAGLVVFKHTDRLITGIPDISITHHKTIWLEVKYANPKILSRGLQHLNMLKLAEVGLAFYIIYDKPKDKTFIVLPKHLGTVLYEAEFNGFDHARVCNFLEEYLQ